MKHLRILLSILLSIAILASAMCCAYAESEGAAPVNERWLYDAYPHIDPTLVIHDISLSKLGPVAQAELEEGCVELPRGSGRIKYNTWFYDAAVVNQFSGSSYVDQYGWNVPFVCFCADQLGYIDAGEMVKTADGGELLSWLQTTDAMIYTRGRVTSQTSPISVCVGDMIFLPSDDLGFDVGIVSEASGDVIKYIMGDSNDSVEELMIKISDLPEASCFVRLHIEMSDKKTIYLFLRQELGLNDAAATGVYANIYWESRLDHGSIGDEGSSFGICQWHNGRWTKLVNFCNSHFYEWDSLDGQLRFLQYELETRYPGLLSDLRNVPDDANGAYTAAFEFCTRFERPAAMEEAGVKRGKYAVQIFGTLEA